MNSDVVIGAGSGMGAAVARRLAAEDRRLVLADIDLDRLDVLASSLEVEVVTRSCDLASVEDVDALAAEVGGLGRLVLTAGLSPTMANGARIFEVDLVGPARVVRAFEPRAGRGSVALVLSSMAGHLVPGSSEIDLAIDDPLAPELLTRLESAGVDVADPASAYMYAKRGVLRLVRRTSVRWGSRGARVVSVSPGIIDTPMGRQEREAQPVMDQMIGASSIGRMIDPDEIAAVIEFLVSPAAVAITGTDVLVDAGVVAAMGA